MQQTKYTITYLDKHKNVRNFYITANNERDAIVNAWLNNKEIVEPLEVKAINNIQAAE